MKNNRKQVTAREIVIDFLICFGFALASLVGFLFLYDYTIGKILSLACVPGALFGILFVAKFIQFLIDAAGRVGERDKQRSEILEKISEPTTSTSADEIAKYKSLLDSGAITSEEFEAKKKQLLNL